ncbi:MAG TPA: zinc metalloprotease [Streptosporangiaceae bacterium]|nr:zinc metalloprotease [Streptosporangiaceae bacterium]
MRLRRVCTLLGVVTAATVPVPAATGRHAGAGCSPAALHARHADVPRDRDVLSPTQVRGLLDDLRRTLIAKFGTADEMAFDPARLPDTGEKIVIPLRFHVITNGRVGRVPKARVVRQVAALNAAYGGRTGGADTGVSFRLTGVSVTANARWFARPKQNDRAMMTALRRGGGNTLNVYSAVVGAEVLGFSTFPQWYRGHPGLDGVVVDYRSLPGGGTAHFNRGYTAVHEVGHWLGLLHTFENGCVPPGDGVADTPYEAAPTEGCPAAKDTCPAPGTDPIHNFMDYGNDDCMRAFTPGQARRIRASWAAYRATPSR